jgi:hypothetical protein
VEIDSTAGFADWPQTKVVGPTDHHPIEPFHDRLRILPTLSRPVSSLIARQMRCTRFFEGTVPSRAQIDSRVLEQAEEQDEPPIQLGLKTEPDEASPSEEGNGGDESNADLPRKKLSKKQQAELLRRQVDTVGRKGEPGEKTKT